MISDADATKYCNCMEEVKRRTSVITNFLNKQNTSGKRITDAEFLCLQFRKILELIALASLTANKDEYARQHSKFTQHWNAKRILEDIERINPQFYPVPGKQIVDSSTGKVLKIEKVEQGFLTRDEFISVYGACSELLHTDNPYGQKTDIIRYEASFDEWLAKVINLLDHHQIQLIDEDYQLWVVMQTKSDGRVHAYTMERFDPNKA